MFFGELVELTPAAVRNFAGHFTGNARINEMNEMNANENFCDGCNLKTSKMTFYL